MSYVDLLFLLSLLLVINSVSSKYSATVTTDGPVVLGAKITFLAVVFKDGVKQQSFYKFKWRDNMYPQNNVTFEKQQGSSKWVVSHSPETYESGTYTVEVSVYIPTILVDWPVCYGRSDFTLEKYLVGDLLLKQNNTPLSTTYVSNHIPLEQQISLHQPDSNYLNSASNLTVFWRVDDVPYNNTKTLKWNHRYSEPDVSHVITATVLALRKKSDTSTEIDINNSNSSANLLLNNSNDEELSYSTLLNSSNVERAIMDGICPDFRRNICGFFRRNITVKAPVQNVIISGDTWLKHGDILNLRLTCNGSAPFRFCVRFFFGKYNVTGNETCKYFVDNSAECDFSVGHYFSNSTLYTVLMIVSNDVHTNISAIGVNIYEVTKHPQLSVIIVPITASILATILIVFGAAFYFQNRNSYTIEVAEFSISNNNDLEPKTFKKRLTEAIHNAFNKPEEFSEEDSSNGVPSTSNKKYGSMQ